MKRLAILVLALGCHVVEPPVPPTLDAGSYSLITVNGRPMPYRDSLGVTWLSSDLAVAQDQTFVEHSTAEHGIAFSGSAHGTIVYRNSGFVFWANGDSTQVIFSAGTMTGDVLTVDFYGAMRIYQREP